MQKKPVTLLYLAELGLGTKAYDPAAMDGLVAWLRANNYDKEVKNVIINGGLLPLIPTYYGVAKSEDMRFLGNDASREPDDISKLVLSPHLDAKDKEYIQKFVATKINNTGQAVEFSKREAKKLLTVLHNPELHYLFGEEDDKNMRALQELKIADYLLTDRKKREKHLREELQDKKGELDKLKQEQTALDRERHKLQKRRNNADRQAAAELKKQLSEKNTESGSLKKAVRTIDLELKAIAREQEAAGFFAVTKRRNIMPSQEEYLFRLAKKEYMANLYQVFDSYEHFHAHPGHEIEQTLEGIVVRLNHKANFRSEAPIGDNVRRLKLENSRLNRRDNVQPDVYLTAHGSGGFRCVPQPKKTEPLEEGLSRSTPDITWDIQLPTFQSEDMLRELREKGLRNVHVKRYDQGSYASGAVLQRFNVDGTVDVEYISTKNLIRFGALTKQIAALGEHEGRKRKSLEAKLRNKTKRMQTLSDVHLGAPNLPGRPSNYEVLDKCIQWQRSNGLPDVLYLGGDVLHGGLRSKGYRSSETSHSLPTTALLEQEKRLLEQAKTPDEQRRALQRVVELYKASALGNPIPVPLQLKAVQGALQPYLNEALQHGARVILQSGNHWNGTGEGRDEAHDLSVLVDPKYSPQVTLFAGVGEHAGCGMHSLGKNQAGEDRVFFGTHDPGRGSDVVDGLLKKLAKANTRVPYAAAGHVHHPGCGYADGTAVTICAGMQTWNAFVQQIGAAAGLRGQVVFSYDLDKDYAKWTFVLDPVLERMK